MIVMKLEDLMIRNKVTAMDIAKHTDLGTSTISRLKNNKAGGIDFNTLEKLCEYFNCTINDIMEIKKEI